MSERREERQRKLNELRARARTDKIRLGVLVGGFVLVLVVYFAVGSLGGGGAEETTSADEQLQRLESSTSIPPVDQEILASVRDSTSSERVILEPEPFAGLAKVALALLPAHLRRLGEPSLPFDRVESESGALRGKPFRLRAEMVDGEMRRRTVGAPDEYWAWLRTDAGEDFFFVSLRTPDVMSLGGENYYLADGFYFKNYTQTFDGQRITAPLLVGRKLAPSRRIAEPVSERDMDLLAEVRDHALGEEAEIDQDGLWHLLNLAYHADASEEALRERFAEAAELNYDTLTAIAARPEEFRGAPVSIYGKIPASPRYRWQETAEENELRLDALSYAFLGNSDLGRNIIHLIAPGDYPFDREGPRQFYGWFLQLYGYLDNENRPSRAPVFVVVGEVPVPAPGPPPMVAQVTIGFLAAAALLALFIAFLAKRDKARAEKMASAIARRRRERGTGTPA